MHDRTLKNLSKMDLPDRAEHKVPHSVGVKTFVLKY